MGLGRSLKKIAGIALPIAGTLLAPGIGTALGSTLSGAALGGIGGAIGGGLGGVVSGGGISGALKGAAMGGVGGYIGSGGLENLFSGTSLSTGSSLGSSITADAARSAASAAASTPTTLGARLTSEVASGLGGGAGGGTAGGFFSGLGDKLTSGVEDMFSTNKLLGEGVKSGLSYALSKDNAGGYRAVQDAATRAAQLYQPYLQAGADAQKRIADLQGLNGPEAQAAARSQFTADPGYQFALGEGVNAIDASAARRGMLQSGNNERAVQEYGSGLASQMYQQYLKNLYGQAGMGMKAAGGVGQNSIDSATAYAMMKAARANRYNQMVGGIAGALLPSPQDQYYASLYQ